MSLKKNKKIAFIIVWFGKLPTWMDFFLLSCSKNYNYKWYIFTDQKYKSNYDNVEFISFTQKDFELLILKKLKFNYTLSNSYKLCDWLPTFGFLFSEYIKDYDFWGKCDLDVIFGDLNNFITDNILNEFDFITKTSHMDLKTGFLPSYTHRVSGPFVLIKNNDYMNSLFMRIDDYHKNLVNKHYTSFDEDHFSRLILKLERGGKLKCFWLNSFEAENSEGTFSDTIWENGKLYLTEENIEIGLNHFRRNKNNYNNIDNNLGNKIMKFEIKENSIDTIEKYQTILKTPYRSPLVVVDAIKDIIKDKVVCELGCAKGDLFPIFSKYAKEVKGLEYKPKYVDFCREQGYNVIQGDWDIDELPEADVYYFWCYNYSQNEPLIERILDKKGFKGKIIAASDATFKEHPEVQTIKECNDRWGGELVIVPFNEGSEYRQSGEFVLTIIDSNNILGKKLVDLVNDDGYLLSCPETSTDKNTIHVYLDVYDKIFKRIQNSAKDVLEIGIFKGGSMVLWHDYFENAIIHGVDQVPEYIPNFLKKYDRIKTYLGGAYNYEDFIKPTFKDMKFDLIIDDGSHQPHVQKRFVKYYLPLLSENGILIIEDLMNIEVAKEVVNAFPKKVRDKVQIIDRRDVNDRYDEILIVYDIQGTNINFPPQGTGHWMDSEDTNLSEKFKNESMIVINTWTETLEQQKLLLDCITNLDLLNMDICLVSHYPIPISIQNLVSYYIYDKYNPKFLMEAGGWFFETDISDNKKLKITFLNDPSGDISQGGHSEAVLNNIKNSFYLAKSINKKYVFFMDNDTIINSKDLHSFYDIFEEVLKSNKKAWFENFGNIPHPKQLHCDFFFSEVNFMLDNIDNITFNESMLEGHLFDCLNNVKHEYILNARTEGEKVRPFGKIFPNSGVNQMHDRPLTHSHLNSGINLQIQNFHLLASVLLPINKKDKLVPLLIIYNHWGYKISWPSFNDSMYVDRDNIFKVSFFLNEKSYGGVYGQKGNEQVNLDKANTSYFKYFGEIQKGNEYRVEVKLYNEYNKGWDLFYQKKWTLDDVDEMRKFGSYEILQKK